MENVNQQPEQELTAEQLNEQKENMLRFYTESLPYLNAQLVYEELLVKIDEGRFKRSSIQKTKCPLEVNISEGIFF